MRSRPRAVFDHERLDVYQAAVQFAELVDRALCDVPAHRSDLADQLRRSSTSIPLNIAEGAGEHSPREKARFYRIALRSATESAATLTLLGRFGVPVDPGARRLLLRIVPMLIRLCKNG